MADDLQTLCELGQYRLMRTEYLEAEINLAAAEEEAWNRKDFDTLSRLYMPLQEARRQRRQRCGEGTVRLDLLAEGPSDHDVGIPRVAQRIIELFPAGQLLLAGWASIEPAIALRRLQREKMLYVETFLAAVYPAGSSRIVVIVPTEDVMLPDAAEGSLDDLLKKMPPHSIILAEDELPRGNRNGDTTTYAEVMMLWERLHLPFLAAADMQVDPIRKIEGYRAAIRVDYACELAHQKASHVARELARTQRGKVV